MEKNLERYPLTQQGAEYIHVHYSQVHQLFPLHVHNYYEVEYVISGVGTQRINGELLPIQKGSAWILGIGDDHLVEGSDLLIANLSLYPPLLPEKRHRTLCAADDELSQPALSGECAAFRRGGEGGGVPKLSQQDFRKLCRLRLCGLSDGGSGGQGKGAAGNNGEKCDGNLRNVWFWLHIQPEPGLCKGVRRVSSAL